MVALLAAAQPDPQWFYSTLAQSTAALVAVPTAFLLFWAPRYQHRVEHLERAARTAVEPVRDSEEWSRSDPGLMEVAEARASAVFPPFGLTVAVVVGILLVAGVGVPLFLLPSPGNDKQATFLAVPAIVVALALLGLATWMIRTWLRLRRIPVSDFALHHWSTYEALSEQWDRRGGRPPGPMRRWRRRLRYERLGLVPGSGTRRDQAGT